MNSYPRESDEFCALDVRVDGQVVTGFHVQVLSRTARPLPNGWAVAVELGGKRGFMTGGRAVGTYRVWARVQDNPEDAVIDAGLIYIT